MDVFNGKLVFLFVLAWSLTAVAKDALPTRTADAFHCDAHACPVPSHGAYPHLIVGRFEAAASASQSKRLFSAMRARHLWQRLPASADDFQHNLQPVGIQLPDGATVVALMTQEEFQVAPPRAGDLVRYSPHRGDFEMPPEDPKARTYWAVDGCVAVVCRRQDKACFGRYLAGVFRARDGAALSPYTFKPLEGAQAIDPDSLLPKDKAPPSS